MKTAYISGPISGAGPRWAEPFMQAEQYLRGQGWSVINPATLGHEDLGYDGHEIPAVHVLRQFLARDFKYLTHCDAIVLIPGWSNSRGANAEVVVAHMTNMATYYFDPLTDDLSLIDPRPKFEIVEFVVGGFE